MDAGLVIGEQCFVAFMLKFEGWGFPNWGQGGGEQSGTENKNKPSLRKQERTTGSSHMAPCASLTGYWGRRGRGQRGWCQTSLIVSPKYTCKWVPLSEP